MDSIILIPTIILGIVCLIVYLVLCYKKSISPNLNVIVNMFLLSSGIICGLLLMLGSVYEPAKAYLKGIDIYIFIGGLAVLFVSGQGLFKDLFLTTHR
ncbi:threonyl-tRNA synthetase [Methylophilus sp. 13]|uniref:threonyl-tRNA synthetase n=1 Tax=Methylophilus sp. 13 TaxID=2781018 RepID=UPI00188F15D4|nr:threonyl-tRNA synthetase [Methylophilus sp. 13]MBF5039362.1 threonyl-tRNA synthetase [Methylophilus sp. 13]